MSDYSGKALRYHYAKHVDINTETIRCGWCEELEKDFKEAEERGARKENEACAEIADSRPRCPNHELAISSCGACSTKMEAHDIADEIRARMEEK